VHFYAISVDALVSADYRFYRIHNYPYFDDSHSYMGCVLFCSVYAMAAISTPNVLELRVYASWVVRGECGVRLF
jgi:hypothetical protein